MSDYDPGLDAIVRTDRFVDALASGARMSSVDPLSAMLGSWRDEVRSQPDAHVVTLAQATAALAQTQKPVRRNRIRFAVVGAAAAAVLAAGGAVAIGYDSWFGQSSVKPRSDAVTLAAQELDQVQQLVNQGKWDEAQQKLVTIAPTVQSVDNTPDKQSLVQQYNLLTAKVIAQNPEATPPPPGAPPPPVNPQSPLSFLPVPVIESPTNSVSSPSIDTNMMLSPASPSSPTSPTVPVSVSPSPTPSSSVSSSVVVPTSSSPSPTSSSPTPTSQSPSPSPSPTPTSQSPSPSPSPTASSSPKPPSSSATATPSPTASSPSQPPVPKQSVASQPPPPPPVTVTTPAVQSPPPPPPATQAPPPPPPAPAPEPKHEPPANSKSSAPNPVPTTSVVPEGPKVR